MYWKPDCVESLVMGINGEFPGPTIKAKAGDTILVKLNNKLHTEGVVIHWHGIRQLETPWADGTAAISQCAINPGDSFLYNFTVDKNGYYQNTCSINNTYLGCKLSRSGKLNLRTLSKWSLNFFTFLIWFKAGTYFYHGHYGMQRSAGFVRVYKYYMEILSGLYGSIIVEVADGQKEPFDYDDEITILLSDWYHQSVHKQEVGLSSKRFRWIGEPQSILMNGKGQFGCSFGAKSIKNSKLCSKDIDEQCKPEVFSVHPNKVYRLRIASTTSLASLNFAIENHTMTLVEADGNYIQPVAVDSLDIYSGDTYSVLIKTNQDPSNYWISANQTARKPPLPPPGVTILNYKSKPVDTPVSPLPSSPEWDDFAESKSFANKILALQSDQLTIPKPPTSFDRRIFLLNTQNNNSGYIRWSINNVSLVLPTTPLLGSLKFGLQNGLDSEKPAENYPSNYNIMEPPVNPSSKSGSSVYKFDYGKTIDVIIQNANALARDTSEVHPRHLHGHDFWVLGYGEGKFSSDSSKLNLENSPLKNNVVLFPHGWTAIRFVTDNPGVWPFHCHIEPHLHMGMGVVFAEAVNRIKTVPDGVLECGTNKEKEVFIRILANMGKAMMMLCFLLPFIFQICLMASAEVKHYDWDVEYMYWKPDCIEHLVMGVNGKFPGPTIRAKAGDTVQVNLTNKLGTEGLVIHWHGIRQINTPWFDGTASISQCAIDVGESFVYNFTVDRAGTYFYHGHFGMQRSAGLYGSIVVDVADGEKEPFAYDGEINLLLSDWWHESVHEQEVGISSKPFRWIGEPQSILINGKGQYNCSLGAKFLNDSVTSCSDTEMSPRCQPYIHSVDQNKTYRVRIASTTSLASISFAIGNHNMTLVEADGNYIQPVSVDSLNIYSGDTYSVLITTNQDPSTNYWIS
ncbi:hypothetical protein C5167_046078, partial [Papaver somniferum]